jgi:hypothetical protein
MRSSARPSQRSGKRAIGCREMGNRRRLRLLRDHVCAAAGESEAEVQAAYARAEVFTNVAALNQHLNAGEATPHFSADGHVWWLRRWTTAEGDEPAKQFMRIAYADVDPQPVPPNGCEASPIPDASSLRDIMCGGYLICPEPVLVK